MSFSIIIPSRNVQNLTACVAAIRAVDEFAQVIVVDDGVKWTMESSVLLDVHHSTILVEGVKPFCFARNVNLGIRAAGLDDVFLLNDDALLCPGDRPLTTMVRAEEYSIYQRGRAWGVVSAAVAGHPGPAFPTSPQRLAELHAGIDPSLWPIRQPSGKMVPFTAVYIPRHVLNDVGLLDERFTGIADGHEVYGGEDDDWCFRARSKGYSIGVYDGCVVNHASLPSTFRPDGKGRSVAGARARFKEIHGFQMGTR